MPEEALSSITEYSINLKDQEAPEPLPVGEYVGVIRAAERRESQRSTMYAAVSCFIDSAQFPPDYTDGNPEGTTITYRRVGLEDNPQARYGTKRFLESIGAPLGKKIDCHEWVGLEAALEITHETYEGVKRAVINRVRAV